jgi:hypothetical protein
MPITDPDWTPPIEMTFDVEKPIRSEQGVLLAGNPIALAMGKPGAPRVQAEATQGSVAGDVLLFGTGGTAVAYEGAADDVFWIPDATFKATTSCEVRVYLEAIRRFSNTAGAFARVYKNGTVVLDHAIPELSYTAAPTVDISLVAGDMVRVQGVGDGTVGAGIRNIQYRTGAQRSVGGI